MAKETSNSKREAGYEATRRLREKHHDEWITLRNEEYTKRGIPVPPSADEKARAQLERLIKDHPDVVAEVLQERAEASGDGG